MTIDSIQFLDGDIFWSTIRGTMKESDCRISATDEYASIYETSWETRINPGDIAVAILRSKTNNPNLKRSALVIKAKELIKQNPPRTVTS